MLCYATYFAKSFEFINYEFWCLKILASSRSQNYTSVDTTTEHFTVRSSLTEGGYNSTLDLYTHVLCACFTIRLKFYLYISWKTKKSVYFCGEASGVKIDLALGIYIWFCCTSCKHRWLKMRYFNTRHWNLY